MSVTIIIIIIIIINVSHHSLHVQTSVPPNLNLGGLGLTTPSGVVAPPLVSPAFAFNSPLTPGLQAQPGGIHGINVWIC